MAVPGSTATVLELSKLPEETYEYVTHQIPVTLATYRYLYRYPEMFQTTSNEAYSVMKRQTGRGGGGGGGGAVEGEYENPQNLPPPTSSQPTTTAAGDSLYEPV